MMKLFRVSLMCAVYLLISIFPFLTVFADPQGDPTSLIPSPLVTGIGSITGFVEILLTNIVLPIGAVVVVFFIIYSGYLFVTAGGSEEKLKTAKQTFLWVVVGAAVLLGSWAIAVAIKTTVCQISPAAGGCPS